MKLRTMVVLWCGILAAQVKCSAESQGLQTAPAAATGGTAAGGTTGSGAGGNPTGGTAGLGGVGGVGGTGGSGSTGGSGGSWTAADSGSAGPEAGPDAPSVDGGSDAAACSGPNPADVSCLISSGQCVPSSCYCSADGVWWCTADCRGGLPPCDAGVGTGGVRGTGGSTGAGGTTGTTDFSPLCSNLLTAAAVSPTKNGICTNTDPQLCYKTCGPQSIGFKSETCVAGVYVEQSGCSFLPGDYSCYRIPAAVDPSCPTELPPQATTPCSVEPCTPCNLDGGYLDSSGAARTGYCVCPPPSTTGGVSKWSCAATTSWPCPAGEGC
jgi:hypothetical protein